MVNNRIDSGQLSHPKAFFISACPDSEQHLMPGWHGHLLEYSAVKLPSYGEMVIERVMAGRELIHYHPTWQIYVLIMI